MMKRRLVSHRTGFWVVAITFLLSMAYSTVPTPLYVLYQHRDGFGTFVITIIFAAYAVGVVMSLYFAGHASDWVGRRRIILAALAAEALSALLFLLSRGVTGLIVARVVSGIGIGAITATATAHLSELRAVSHPWEKGSRAALVATIVNTGGLALGPILSGLLAQTVSRPLALPYAGFGLLLLAAIAAMVLVPETVERAGARRPYRPQRLSVGGANGPQLIAAAVGVVAAFALFGMFSSLAPSFVAGTLHNSSRLAAGLVAGSVFAAATFVQVALSPFGRRVQLVAGIAAMSAGLVLVTVAMFLGSFAIFLLAGLLSGAGAGLIMRSSIATAASLAAPEARAAVLSFIFLMGYLGLSLPVIGLGLALMVLPGRFALLIFASVVLAVILWAGTRMVRQEAPAERDTAVKAA